MPQSVEDSPRTEVVTETTSTADPAAETSLLRVIWYPILLFVAGPAIVMLAVKLVFGI